MARRERLGGKTRPLADAISQLTLETLEQRLLLSATPASFAPKSDYGAGTEPICVTAADLNGDGRPDLATANWSSNTVSVLLNNGSGGFLPKVDYAAGNRPHCIIAADFNGDGRCDLAEGNTNGDGTIGVLLNTGGGGFGPRVNYLVGTAGYSVTSADFNNDGKPDLAVADCGMNKVSVLLNNGSGGFGPKADYAAGSNSVFVASADFNGDGWLDLVVANNNANSTVSVLLNNGSGGFLPKVDYATGTYSTSVTTADLNGDGRPDLAVTYSGNTVSVLLNNGSGGFLPKVDYATGTYPTCVTSADFNGDGWPDLAVANDSGNSVSVLLGNGNGTFQSKVDYVTGGTPFSMTSADFNGDGRPDLATANWSSNTVSVLMNTTPFGTTTMPGTWLWDIESDQLVGSLFLPSASADLFWEQYTSTTRELVPCGNARIGIITGRSYGNVDLAYLQSLNLGTSPISGSDVGSQLTPGTVLGFRTAEGNYAKLQVVNCGYNITLQWYLYGSQQQVADIGDTLASAMQLGSLGYGGFSLSSRIGNIAWGCRDVDLFQFSLSTARVVHLWVNAQSFGSGLDGYLRLFDSSGNQIAANDDSRGLDPDLRASLCPGTYYVGVSGYPNQYYTPSGAGSGVLGSAGVYCLFVESYQSSGSWSPTITASAAYDGNTDPAIFGKYLTGSAVRDVWDTFSASVTPSTGYTTTAVCFDSDFDGIRDAGDYIDTTGGNGWTYSLNVSRLSGDKTMKIWAQESGGQWSSPATFTISTLSLPSWVDSDPDKTTITFDTSSQHYSLRSLIGQRIGANTPSDWPSWLAYRDGKPTFNGMYFGTMVEADYSLGGRVLSSEINPCLGFLVFGCGPEFKFDVSSASSGSMTIDPYKFWKAYTDPVGCLNDALPLTPTKIGIDLNPPAVTFSWDQHAALRDDLTFGTFQQTFSISLDAKNLFEVTLPKFWAPTPIPFVDVAVTPHFGFGPYITASWTTTQGGGVPQITASSISAGVEVSLGAAAELELLGGLGAVGLDGTVTGDLGFDASRSGSGPWSFKIPVTLGVDLDLIGSIGWGWWEGRCNLVHFSTSMDLYNSGSSMAIASPTSDASGSGSGTDPTILSRGVARSSAGDMAIAWSPVDLAGTAQPLFVQRRTPAGVWGAVETVTSSNHFRGEPALAYLPDGRLMTLWSESKLDASTVPGMDANAACAGQEIYWSVRSAGGWSTPQLLTNDSLLDDQPAIAVRSDGTAVAVWRHASAVDITNPAALNLCYASYNGSSWTAPLTMVDDAKANGRAALVASGTSDIVATWLASSSLPGDDATVWSSVLHAGIWSSPVVLTDTTGNMRRSPRLVYIPDGRVLAFWTEETQDGCTMRMATRAANGTWSASSEVLPGQQCIGSPIITTYGSRVDVVWHGIGGTKSSIFSVSRDFANDQGWSQPLELTVGAGQNWWAMPGAESTGSLGLAYVADAARGAVPLAPIEALTESGTSSQNNIQMLSVTQLPDLAVKATDISLASTPPAPTQANTVHVSVSNQGLIASPSTTVALYDGNPSTGGALIGTRSLAALPIGGSATVDFSWTPTTGTHQLWAVVDPSHLLTELDATNNQTNASFAAVNIPTLALDPASDTGTIGDNRTTVSSPTITGAAAGAASVTIFRDSQASPVAQATVSGGTYSVTLPALTNDLHTLWGQAYDASGNPSLFSVPLSLSVEPASLAAPLAPTLDAASDTGVVGDNRTKLVRPTFIGAVKANASVLVYDGASLLGQVTAATDGSFSFQPTSDMTAGSHSITVVQCDDLGNQSPASSSLAISIDTTSPSISQWSSAATHGAVGEVLLAIPDDGSFSEPRNAGIRRLVVQFSEPIAPASFISSSIQIAGHDINGNDLNLSGIGITTSLRNGDTEGVIDFSALPNAARYIVRIQGVTDVAGNPLAGDDDRIIGTLIGDATGDGVVDAADYIALKWAFGASIVSLTNASIDFDCSGMVDYGDLMALMGSFGQRSITPQGPRIVAHWPDGLIGAGVDHVDVTFNEPIDASTFTAADVLVVLTTPMEVGYCDMPGYAYGVQVVGTLAYVADDFGLRILDVSNPVAPVEVGHYDTPDCACDVQVVGSLAYVADLASGLRIIDVSNPAAPAGVGYCDMPGYAYGVQVVGMLAYVAGDYSGLRIINVSNPAAPAEVGYCDTPGYAQSVQVVGSLAYVADLASGLRIIDVSNPAAPAEVGYCDMPGYAYGVQVVGMLAYVAGDYSGLRIIDVSNPAAPAEVGYCDTPGYAERVQVVGSLAYVADSPSGLRIIDVSNPAAPEEVGYCDMPGYAYGVQVVGTLAYVACNEGMRIIEVGQAVQGISQLDATTYRVQLSSPMADGAYRVFVGPDIADLAGNTMDQDADGIGGETADDVYSFTFEQDTGTGVGITVLRDDFSGTANAPLDSNLWQVFTDTGNQGTQGGSVTQTGDGRAHVAVASEWTGTGFYTTQTFANVGQYHIEGKVEFTRGTNPADNVFMLIRNADITTRESQYYMSYTGPHIRLDIHPTHSPMQDGFTSVYAQVKNSTGYQLPQGTSNDISWSGTTTVVMSVDYNADTGQVSLVVYNDNKTQVLTHGTFTLDAQTRTDIGANFRVEMGMDGYDSYDHYWDYIEVTRLPVVEGQVISTAANDSPGVAKVQASADTGTLATLDVSDIQNGPAESIESLMITASAANVDVLSESGHPPMSVAVASATDLLAIAASVLGNCVPPGRKSVTLPVAWHSNPLPNIRSRGCMGLLSTCQLPLLPIVLAAQAVPDALQLAGPWRLNESAEHEPPDEPWMTMPTVDIAGKPRKGRLDPLGLDVLAARR